MKLIFSTILIICFFISSGWSQSQVKIPTITSGTIAKRTIHTNYKLSAAAGQVAIDSIGNSNYSMFFGFWSEYHITGIEDENDLLLPKVFDLRQNYPNPFNPVTTIEYALPRISEVTIEIYNILGQQVAKLVNDKQPPGYYSVKWEGLNSNGSSVSNGMYIYRMIAHSAEGRLFVKSKKMLFLK